MAVIVNILVCPLPNVNKKKKCQGIDYQDRLYPCLCAELFRGGSELTARVVDPFNQIRVRLRPGHALNSERRITAKKIALQNERF